MSPVFRTLFSPFTPQGRQHNTQAKQHRFLCQHGNPRLPCYLHHQPHLKIPENRFATTSSWNLVGYDLAPGVLIRPDGNIEDNSG